MIILKKTDVVIISTYGGFLDLPFLIISAFKKNVIVDVHEVVSLDNNSNVVYKIFKAFYSKTSSIAISHSKKTDVVLNDFGFKNTILNVPLFTYKLNKSINVANIGQDVLDTVKNADRYLLFFGNIRPSKGIFELLDALKTIDEKKVSMPYKVIIAGQDNSGLLTEVVASNTSKSSTRFIIRYLNDDEINYLIENSSFILLPYKDVSQSGILEMAFPFSKPIISSDIPYFRDLFAATPSFGYIINCSDNDAFASQLASVRTDNLADYYNADDIKTFLKAEEFDAFVKQFKAILAIN